MAHAAMAAKEEMMFDAARISDLLADHLPKVPVNPPPTEACDHSRHARLFELLRQQDLADRITQRIDRRAHPRVTRGNSLLLQRMAATSFQVQRTG